MFHDALKGWSCCNKKSTDFTQFLSIPGCTKSAHSNIKPPEPEKKVPVKDEIQLAKDQVLVFETMKPPEPLPRPTDDAPLVELPRTVASNLIQALEKLNESMKTISLGECFFYKFNLFTFYKIKVILFEKKMVILTKVYQLELHVITQLAKL